MEKENDWPPVLRKVCDPSYGAARESGKDVPLNSGEFPLEIQFI